MQNNSNNLILNFSIAIPVYNEEKNIINLLDSLFAQSYKPKEIIISDGGSSDRTVQLINNYILNNKKDIQIKIIGREGKCRGSGRNIAIKNCQSKYIALIDSGHIADKDWLKGFAKFISRQDNADVIFGTVHPIKNNFFNKIVSSFILGNKKHDGKIKETVASMLIKKSVFEKIGFFLESNNGTYVVEDLNFIKKIKNSKNIIKFYLESSFTSWNVSENYQQLFNKYVSYSIGAINAGYFNLWHKNVFRNILLAIIIIIFSLKITFIPFIILLFLLLFLRSLFYLNKNNWFNESIFLMKMKYILALSYLLILIDYAAIKGFFLWFFKKIKVN